MARVTDEEVRKIINTNITDISAFITAANLLVTNKLGDSDLDDDTLKQIELWISAHAVTIQDRSESLAEKEVDEAKEKYTGKFGMGLNSTKYGQMAIDLDTTKILRADIVVKRKAFFETN